MYSVTMLDSTQLRVALPKKSNGQDCLDQVRELQQLAQESRDYLTFDFRFVALLVSSRKNTSGCNILASQERRCG